MYLIKVDGNIIVEFGRHCAQNWAGRGFCDTIYQETYLFDPIAHNVKSDLILSQDRRAIPYAVYCSEIHGAGAKSGGADLVASPGYQAALFYYRESIDNISHKLKKNYPDDISEDIYKSLYIDIWGTLELLLSDLILCLIYRYDNVLEKALVYYRDKKDKKDKNVADVECKNVKDIEYKVHNYFFQGIVYHRFDHVEELYDRVLDITIPNTYKLRKLIHKRNNIVHRNSLSNRDRMTVTKVSLDDVNNLINVVEKFVNELDVEVGKQYKK